MIVIVDYGMGNLQSVARALRSLECQVCVSSRLEDIVAAEKLVLPGVGSFAAGMENLARLNLTQLLHHRVIEQGVPILGICLGFQMLTRRSAEGPAEGLGWLDAATHRLNAKGNDPSLKIPHIGWNDVRIQGPSPLMAGLPASSCFYFAHSYAVSCADSSNVLATTDYGGEFVSAAQAGNIYGTQFHPEKSHAAGLALLKNFVERA